MKKSFYIPLGLLLFSLFLGLINKWSWQGLQKPSTQNSLESISAAGLGQNDYKEFITAEKTFRINYPGDWFRLEDENILAVLNSKEWGEKYSLKTIFAAQNLLQGKFSQITVQEGVFDINIKEIIKKMEETNQKQQVKMEIVKSDIVGDKGFFEARYVMPSGPNLYSKEEILVNGEKAYLVSFIAPEKDWQEFGDEADFIIKSAQLMTGL